MPKGEKSGTRGTNWAFLVYPESAPDGWMDILNMQQIDCMISPKHNPDNVVEENESGDMGEHNSCRKIHYHVLLVFGAGRNKSREQVQKIADLVNGTKVIKVESLQGYAKYLCHLGSRNKHKEQFPAGTMPTVFGDIDYLDIISSEHDVRKNTKDMMMFIDKYEFRYLYEFAAYCARKNDQWLDTLTSKRTLFFREYINSKRFAEKDGALVDIDAMIERICELEQKELEQ